MYKFEAVAEDCHPARLTWWQHFLHSAGVGADLNQANTWCFGKCGAQFLCRKGAQGNEVQRGSAFQFQLN